MIVLTSDLTATHTGGLSCSSISDTEAQAFLVLRTDFEEQTAHGYTDTSTGES
jgi:hypothetical protein